MKKIMFLLCAAALLAVACNKEDDNPSPENPVNPSDTTQVDPPTDGMIPNALSDIDGNVYDAVRIGNQVWMASNLRTTRYANGDVIPEGQTSSNTAPYRYTPSTDVAEYGYLYNWAAVMHGEASSTANPSGVQGVCPDGWHVPSDAEWSQLTDYLGSHSEYVCSGNGQNIAKALAADHGWTMTTGDECAVGYDQSGNNSTGFSALPAGGYYGSCCFFGNYALFWSATEDDDYIVYGRYLNYYYALVYRYTNNKDNGFSVRCVRD